MIKFKNHLIAVVLILALFVSISSVSAYDIDSNAVGLNDDDNADVNLGYCENVETDGSSSLSENYGIDVNNASGQILQSGIGESRVGASTLRGEISINSQYKGTVYAGVNNLISVKINNTGESATYVGVDLVMGNETIGSALIPDYNANNIYSLSFVDDTIKPLTENTVYGNNNYNVTYTVVVKDSNGGLINESSSSFTVLYNGNLGKDLEYPGADPILREFVVTGDVIVLKTDAYSAAGDTNRTDVFSVDLNGNNVSAALLYVSYNWDKDENGDFNNWNTTFNGEEITPIASFRDQGNMGTYAKNAYGLVVYDVTDLVTDGENTFVINKTKGMVAVYPSNLIVLTDDESSNIKKTIYIYEEADLLSKTNNKNLITGFNTTFDVIDGNATLYVFAASAENNEGNVIVNDVNNTNVWSGTSKSFDIFTTDVDSGSIDVFFESTGSTILALHQMVVVESDLFNADVSISSQYKNTVYAGVNNTLTVVVTNKGKAAENVTVVLFLDDDEIGSQVISKFDADASETLTFVDPTIRPLTENTVYGNNNTNANYTVIIKDSDNYTTNFVEYNPVVLYNGNLGKDFEYPGADPIMRKFVVTGDVIVLNTDAYSAAGDTNRTDVFNVTLNGDVSKALLYVSYNWDKDENGDFNNWNTTFNGEEITPIASYRDQGNMGTYAKNAYGLVVYDVTDLVVDGENTFVINKTKGMVAVYPSNLIVLTDNENSTTAKIVYIYEEADLLSKTNNKNLAAGFNTTFDVFGNNGTLYVFAASAQSDEGNVIVNGVNNTNVWNGTFKSFDTFTTDVDSGNLSIYFESIGGTILALHQMVISENPIVSINAPDLIKYKGSKDKFVVNVTDFENNPAVNTTVQITINGVTYNRTTDENGVASMNINLNPGEYQATVTVNKTSVNATITVLTTVNGTDITKVFKNGTQYYATFRDINGNYLADGTEVEFNINGVMYKRYINGSEGKAKLNINLNPGEYVITATNPNSTEMSSNIIKVISQVSESNDLVKYFKNDSQYRVKIVDIEGNAVGANETVKFNINGVMYERQTDEEGYAQLNINLNPGNYVITAEYNGSMVSNNIEVLPVLTAYDLTMKAGTSDQFKARLVDGQGELYPNQRIDFNINGQFFNSTTDAEGTAALTINLGVGQYTITSSYGDAAIANIITVY